MTLSQLQELFHNKDLRTMQNPCIDIYYYAEHQDFYSLYMKWLPTE